MNKKNSRGFTLFELAVVLFLAAIIIGAIVIGKVVISVSELRWEAGKFVEFEAAFNTFKLKYNAVPGDFNQPNLIDGVTPGHYGNGDGTLSGIQESFYVWEHLSKSKLIGGTYDGNAVNDSITNSYKCNLDTSCPATSFNGHTAHLMGSIKNLWGSTIYSSDLVKSSQSIAVFIVNEDGLAGGPHGELSVDEAHALDDKIDDGVASTGRVLTINDVFNTGNCVNGDITAPTADYNLSNSSSDCLSAYVIH